MAIKNIFWDVDGVLANLNFAYYNFLTKHPKYKPMNADIKWEDCHWAKPHEAAFMKNSTGKHVYLGHIDSETIREVWNEPKGNYELYTRPSGDVTYLDSCTIYTHKLNMVVVEDEEIE